VNSVPVKALRPPSLSQNTYTEVQHRIDQYRKHHVARIFFGPVNSPLSSYPPSLLLHPASPCTQSDLRVPPLPFSSSSYSSWSVAFRCFNYHYHHHGSRRRHHHQHHHLHLRSFTQTNTHKQLANFFHFFAGSKKKKKVSLKSHFLQIQIQKSDTISTSIKTYSFINSPTIPGGRRDCHGDQVRAWSDQDYENVLAKGSGRRFWHHRAKYGGRIGRNRERNDGLHGAGR
jgi:hypothetical protein